MNNKWFTYIKIYEDKNKVKTSGIRFKEFIDGIDKRPKNILILSGESEFSYRNININFDYVKNDDLENLYNEDVYSFGDFNWIDFDKESNLENIDKLELSKILYINHIKEPFDTFLFKSLNNNYVYLSHDDDYIVNIYMKNINTYKNVINNKILKEFKGRKRYIKNLPDEMLDYIYDLCKIGIIIDFEELSFNSVRIYTVGEVKLLDEAHEKLDKYRKKLNGVSLCYNTKNKKWKLYD